jgi:hypothetical protein
MNNDYEYDMSACETRREPEPETECRDCGGDLDDDGYCLECGKNYNI